ncbi:MAG: UDP-N-acetylmuramoyl-L-alanyl-D-glutamate--2,6-diaminopimelate ligase [Treponema sp.]|nr:UDP-N-acetylmuramoyl-L-alanyl-D-glutamate--2,6-diaminopimelate ligase [Treponema sp.]
MASAEDDPPLPGSANPLVTGLEYDSRKIKPGNLFFAFPGIHADGHAFIAGAVSRGAEVIIHQEKLGLYKDGVTYIRVKDARLAMSAVADAFYGFPSHHMAVIGVTGTEGKSTTVYLIYQLLRLLGVKAGFISTVQRGDGKTEFPNPEHQTTPEAVTVHRLLAEMRRNGAEIAVVEASSHGLSKKTGRLGDVSFDVGVMTNVNHEHLEFHGTWEQYRNDKAELFRTLDSSSHTKLDKKNFSSRNQAAVPSFGVVNADDPSASYFAAATRHKTYTYSARGAGADLSLRIIESGGGGNWYEVYTAADGEAAIIRDRLPGAFNAGNVLAALLTVSQLMSLPVTQLAPLVSRLKPVRGRMTALQKGQPFEVLVDYAHTPSSFEAIFPPLRERLSPEGRRIISVFGSAGERDTKKRSEQGRIAARYSDMVILTDEDPRGEAPMSILEEIAKGCEADREYESKTRNKDLFLIPDRPAAIRKAFSLAEKGDLVLLLGKGHENSIIYAKETVPYDEIAEAGKALEELGYRETEAIRKV